MGIIFSFVALLLLLFYIVLNARYSEKYKTVSGLKKKSMMEKKNAANSLGRRRVKIGQGEKGASPFFICFVGKLCSLKIQQSSPFSFPGVLKKKKKRGLRIRSPMG